MKTYTIIAGVNGCGKSSLTGVLRTEINNLGRIIDVDKITVACGGNSIENRVKKGGHNIDTEAVTKRFDKRFEDLLTVLPYCNEAIFYDNDNGFVTVAKYKNGELQPIGHKQPNWLNELIEKMNWFECVC